MLQKILSNEPINYRIGFPVEDQLLQITEIKVNNRLVCKGQGFEGKVFEVSFRHTLRANSPTATSKMDLLHQKLPIFAQFVNKKLRPALDMGQTTTKPPITSKSPPAELLRVCGQTTIFYRPLVIGGSFIEIGSYPWLVALYVSSPKSLSFNCGGNLISSRTVLTAAHCLKLRRVVYEAKDLLVVAGRYNILDWSESTSRKSTVKKIIIYPGYDPTLANFDGDLAIIILEETMT